MSHFVHVTSEEHFGGSRFNGHIMEHCTFLFVDEGVGLFYRAVDGHDKIFYCFLPWAWGSPAFALRQAFQ